MAIGLKKTHALSVVAASSVVAACTERASQKNGAVDDRLMCVQEAESMALPMWSVLMLAG